jgi:hypothetical protein
MPTISAQLEVDAIKPIRSTNYYKLIEGADEYRIPICSAKEK